MVRAGATLLAGLAIAACMPLDSGLQTDVVVRESPTPRPFDAAAGDGACDVAPSTSAGAAPAIRHVEPSLSLRGDATFDPARMAPGARVWYDRLWTAIEDENQNARIVRLAHSDDLYEYGRSVNTHVLALLTAFRVTGDLSLLDEVDRLAQMMRARLADSWRGAIGRPRRQRDGYLNWVWRGARSVEHFGRDLHETDEMRTHALIAELAWTFHINRDLASPSGVDYRERSTFWTRYLLEHFEPKWRGRNGVPEAFPFVSRPYVHETMAFVKYHHYLSKVRASDSRGAEAVRLGRRVLDSMVRVTTAAGDEAVVWPRALRGTDPGLDYLMPATYARYVIADVVDLHLDGAPDWGDGAVVEALAVTVRDFMLSSIDGGGVLHRDVGGGVARGGIRASDSDAWSRQSADTYRFSSYGFVALWDRTSAVATLNCELHATSSESSRSVQLPAANLLATARR